MSRKLLKRLARNASAAVASWKVRLPPVSGVTAASTLWSTKVSAQTPKKGGTFRVGVHDGNTADSLDPGTTESVFMIQLNHASRSYLTEITNTNQLGPDIATDWSASDDASEWKFNLSKGVTFHSGKSMTSADVVDSLNHHRGEKTTSAAKALLADVTDISADGDHAITIKLKAAQCRSPLPFVRLPPCYPAIQGRWHC